MDTSTLLAQRYGNDIDASLPFLSQLNPVIETMFNHRSVRHFEDKPVNDDVLNTLFAAAQSAPTSSNLQLWTAIAVTDQKKKQRFASLCGDQKHIIHAPLFIVWVADISRIRRLAKLEGEMSEGTNYTESFLMCALDVALAAQNFSLAAESLGLGTVFVGGLRNNALEVVEEVNLQDGMFPIFGMSVGYPDPNKPAAVKPRLPLSAVVHKDTYHVRPVQQEIGNYDDVAQAFAEKHGMRDQLWSQKVMARMESAMSLTGRDVLKAEIIKQGFPLR